MALRLSTHVTQIVRSPSKSFAAAAICFSFGILVGPLFLGFDRVLLISIFVAIFPIIVSFPSPSKGEGQGEVRVAIVGSALFAEPLRHLFAEQRATVERVDPLDPTLADKTRTADILVVAVGKPGLIVGSMVKPGAIVIDVGTTKVGRRVVGDVDAESVLPVAGALSPVPGGAGPMTVAMLTLNVLKAAELQKNKK